MMFERWRRGYRRWALRRGWKESTLVGRDIWLEVFFQFLKDRNLQSPTDVHRSLLHEYESHLVVLENRLGRPYAASTRGQMLSTVRTFYRFLLEEGRILVDPTYGMRLPRLGDRLPRSVLTADEMRRLLLTPDVTDPWGLRDRAILELFYGAGLRYRELAALRVGDIDLEERTIWIREGKGAKDRVLPLGRWATHWLGRYLAESDSLRRQQGTDRVFLTPKGNVLANRTLGILLTRYAQKAGISRRISPHSLRHTFATLLLRGGADVRKIQQLLGHTRLTTTELYTRLDLTDLRRVQETYHPREKGRK